MRVVKLAVLGGMLAAMAAGCGDDKSAAPKDAKPLPPPPSMSGGGDGKFSKGKSPSSTAD